MIFSIESNIVIYTAGSVIWFVLIDMDGAESSTNINSYHSLLPKTACQNIRGGECKTMPCCARDTQGHKIKCMEDIYICGTCLMNIC